MSDDDIIDPGDRRDQAAAEYVLGVLGPEERRAAELRLEREPKFAAEVAFWEARLGGLAESVAPVPPPAKVWQRIDAAISAGAKPTPQRAGQGRASPSGGASPSPRRDLRRQASPA